MNCNQLGVPVDEKGCHPDGSLCRDMGVRDHMIQLIPAPVGWRVVTKDQDGRYVDHVIAWALCETCDGYRYVLPVVTEDAATGVAPLFMFELLLAPDEDDDVS